MQNDGIESKAGFEVDENELEAFIPPIPSSFPEFNAMPLFEVTRITENKTFLDMFVEGTSEITFLRETKQSIEASNVEIAKANMACEEKFETLSTDVETLKQDLNNKMQKY